MSIYQSAVRKPVTTALIYVALAVIGVFSLSGYPLISASISDNNILVMTTYSGASAADIENNVTKCWRVL